MWFSLVVFLRCRICKGRSLRLESEFRFNFWLHRDKFDISVIPRWVSWCGVSFSYQLAQWGNETQVNTEIILLFTITIILHSPLPPLRGQPTVKCHPRWQPISGLVVHCRLGRLLDSNPGLQFYNLMSLPMSHHCSLNHLENICLFYLSYVKIKKVTYTQH